MIYNKKILGSILIIIGVLFSFISAYIMHKYNSEWFGFVLFMWSWMLTVLSCMSGIFFILYTSITGKK